MLQEILNPLVKMQLGSHSVPSSLSEQYYNRFWVPCIISGILRAAQAHLIFSTLFPLYQTCSRMQNHERPYAKRTTPVYIDI